MKETKLQQRLLYLARISFRFKGELKSFTDQQKKKKKDKRIQRHQTSFTTNAKETSLGWKHKRKKRPTKTNPKE